MEEIVSIRNVTKTFPSAGNNLVILDQVDFSLAKGALISLTGESGSGKSTLLNLIAGLDHVTSGEIVSCGTIIHGQTEAGLSGYRRDSLGFIFQFHFLLGEFTALENVYLPALMAGVSKAQAAQRALSLLGDVGLVERKDHFPSQLSGGERQRVALARALINDPPLILADEPTGNLDEENSRMVEDLLFDLSRKKGKTLLLVTHDRTLAARADQQYHMVHRKVVAQ